MAVLTFSPVLGDSELHLSHSEHELLRKGGCDNKSPILAKRTKLKYLSYVLGEYDELTVVCFNTIMSIFTESFKHVSRIRESI
jgi:hypothetical protein